MLTLSWLVADRDRLAGQLVEDIHGRLDSRVKISIEGHCAYGYAIKDSFWLGDGFGQSIKILNRREGG